MQIEQLLLLPLGHFPIGLFLRVLEGIVVLVVQQQGDDLGPGIVLPRLFWQHIIITVLIRAAHAGLKPAGLVTAREWQTWSDATF